MSQYVVLMNLVKVAISISNLKQTKYEVVPDLGQVYSSESVLRSKHSSKDLQKSLNQRKLQNYLFRNDYNEYPLKTVQYPN